MISLLVLTKILKLEFFALAQIHMGLPNDFKTSIAYAHPNLPDSIFWRHFLTSCQFAIGDFDKTFGCDYFWDCQEFLFCQNKTDE